MLLSNDLFCTFAVEGWNVGDEHSVKHIVTILIVLSKCLRMEKRSSLAGGECESENRNGEDDEALDVLMPFNSGVKTTIGPKSLWCE